MVININLQGRRKPPQWMLYLPGGIMVAIGLTIILFPALVKLLIGGTCLVIGLVLLAVPMRME